MLRLVRYKIVLACWVVGICLSCIAHNSFAQGKLPTSKVDSHYIERVKYYRYLNPDSALYYVKLGLKNAELNQSDIGKAALLNQYGMIDDNATRYKESREKYLQAERIYREKNDEQGVAAILIRLAVVERRKGNFDKALAYALDALKLSEHNKHSLGILEGRVVLAETFYDLADYQNALKNLKIAEKIESQIPLTNLSLNMFDDFGSTYIKLKDYDQAIQYIQRGLSKSNKVAYNGLRISLLKTLGKAYQLKGDNNQAEKIFKEALAFSREIKNVLREQAILIELATVYEKTQPDTSLKYLNLAFDIVAKFKMYRQEISVLNKISALHKQKGDLSKALETKERSNELAEQVFYKDMMKQVFSLEAAYDLEKSKVELSELTTKSKEQQSAKNIILAIALGVFVVLIVTVVYYMRSRKLNKLLTKANVKLEESNEVKDKLFSIIAHDIRSPLVSTVGIMKLIGDKELDEDTQHQMVNKLVAHCDNSLEILDKLLKWGQMQIKGVRLNASEFNPMQNIRRNLAMLQEAAAQKNIAINLDIPSNVVLNADADHFDFIVRNLTSNAIKFTEMNGKVELKATVLPSNKIKFEVKDNGVGISKARIDKIFELSAMGTKGTKSE
ncbi:MAG: tetratricopeptide repeat protein, partial [Chitinophagaceae bacterium]